MAFTSQVNAAADTELQTHTNDTPGEDKEGPGPRLQDTGVLSTNRAVACSRQARVRESESLWHPLLPQSHKVGPLKASLGSADISEPNSPNPESN